MSAGCVTFDEPEATFCSFRDSWSGWLQQDAMRRQVDIGVRIGCQHVGHDGADAIRQVERLALVGSDLRLQSVPPQMHLAVKFWQSVRQQRIEVETKGVACQMCDASSVKWECMLAKLLVEPLRQFNGPAP